LVGPGRARADLPNDEAWQLCHIDGWFAPKRGRSGKLCWQAQAKTVEEDHALHWDIRDSAEYPQGQFLRHRHGKWSLLQWWDRAQGDKRGACNSSILLEGEHTTEELLAALKEHFPHVLANLDKAGVELVEVFP